MGYTHYWRIDSKRGAKGTAAKNEKAYQTAIIKCAKLIRDYSKEHGGLSGYTAHDKTGRYGGLNVNGSDRVGQCESFVMREHLSQNEAFSFCKTRQHPYDTVVAACLIIIQHYCPDSIQVSSDGDASDWADALTLARTVPGLKKAQLPVSIEDRQKRLA